MLCGVAKDLTKLGGKTGTNPSQTYVELNSAARQVQNTLNTYVELNHSFEINTTGIKNTQNIN